MGDQALPPKLDLYQKRLEREFDDRSRQKSKSPLS